MTSHVLLPLRMLVSGYVILVLATSCTRTPQAPLTSTVEPTRHSTPNSVPSVDVVASRARAVETCAPDITDPALLARELDALPSKRAVVERLVQIQLVYLSFDPRRPGVIVPENQRNQEQMVLVFGKDLWTPIPDLHIDDNGITGSFSFNRTPFPCTIPWSAVKGVKSQVGVYRTWSNAGSTQASGNASSIDDALWQLCTLPTKREALEQMLKTQRVRVYFRTPGPGTQTTSSPNEPSFAFVDVGPRTAEPSLKIDASGFSLSRTADGGVESVTVAWESVYLLRAEEGVLSREWVADRPPSL